MEGPRREYTAELLRHFADLRDGTHGGAVSRREKERLFMTAVGLLDPYARQALEEINADLLLGSGEVSATGVRCRGDGQDAIWALSWPEQQAAAIKPIIIRAYYGVGAHHPHLRAGTAGDWPLNVFDEKQAAAELPTLRAVTAADLHNLVFQRDYRIIPAIVHGWAPAEGSEKGLPGPAGLDAHHDLRGAVGQAEQAVKQGEGDRADVGPGEAGASWAKARWCRRTRGRGEEPGL